MSTGNGTVPTADQQPQRTFANVYQVGRLQWRADHDECTHQPGKGWTAESATRRVERIHATWKNER
jgi:hypothetical protein